jgi:uncharacterized protein
MNLRLLRIIALIAIPLFILSISSSYIFEWFWLNELGYTQVFWMLRGTQVILTIAAFLLAGTYFVSNFRHLAGQLKNANLSASPLEGSNINLSSDFALRRIKQFFTLAGLAMALIFALSFYLRWDESLRFISSVPFGESDPLFGRDIGFYLFQLPFWDLVQSSLLSIAFITLLIITLAYVFTGLLMVRSFTDFSAGKSVMNHIKINAGIWLALLAWGFYLARYNLLLKSDGIVFGATYIDVTVHLPAIWVLVGLTLILALLVFASRWVKTGKAIPVAGVLLAATLIIGRGILPGMVQQFSVDPNELQLETPYLEKNIEMTRLAYNLHNVREVDYVADDTLTVTDIPTTRMR